MAQHALVDARQRRNRIHGNTSVRNWRRRSPAATASNPPPSVAKYFTLSTGEAGQLTILFITEFSANSLGLALLPFEEATALVVQVGYQDNSRTVKQVVLTLVDSSPTTLQAVCELVCQQMAPWGYYEQLHTEPLPLPPPTPPSQ